MTTTNFKIKQIAFVHLITAFRAHLFICQLNLTPRNLIRRRFVTSNTIDTRDILLLLLLL